MSVAEYSLSEDTMSAECSLWLFLRTGQHSEFLGLVSWGWSWRNMFVWVRGFRWVGFFPPCHKHHNARQSVRRTNRNHKQTLVLTQHCLSLAVTGTARVLDSDYYLLWKTPLWRWSITRTELVPSPPFCDSDDSLALLQLLPLSWHPHKAHKGSSLLGALPGDKDMWVLNMVVLHKMSWVKRRQHRQKGVS